MSKGYIDFALVDKFPNKYKLKPSDIKRLVVLDWERLKKLTWKNNAMKIGEWWCHLEGSGGGFYDSEDEFWIGFNAENGKVDYHFTSREGMCHYNFTTFYDINSIENKWDMIIQTKAIGFLNMLLDEKIVDITPVNK